MLMETMVRVDEMKRHAIYICKSVSENSHAVSHREEEGQKKRSPFLYLS